MTTATQEPSDEIWTIPNVLTFIRLGLLVPYCWLVFGFERIDLGLGIAFLGLVSDLADGKIARATGKITKLGIALDPLADRLGVAAAIATLLVHEQLAPVWLVLTVAARDVILVLVGVPILKARGIPIPPVSKVGKFGSFWTSIALGVFIGAGWTDPSEPIRAVQLSAYAIAAVGIPAYWAAGLGYARAVIAPRTGR